MTHFEFWKTSKTALENQVKKRIRARKPRKIRRGLAWKDKTTTWQAHAARGIITRRAA
jgi:hypothetical protein